MYVVWFVLIVTCEVYGFLFQVCKCVYLNEYNKTEPEHRNRIVTKPSLVCTICVYVHNPYPCRDEERVHKLYEKKEKNKRNKRVQLKRF